ncbi:MAG: lipooligosaccharide sialyltransferase [Lachnospiraceae bacterium]|nr:lipooligosaccharide sialyltransferase [Lachnospiraceae bacterium]
MKERIYVCHTYYHVYVTFLKELNLPKEKRGQATLVLSRMSNDFEQLKERVERTGLFESVVEYDEKREDYFPQLDKYRKDRGNIVSNMIARIIFTKKLAKLNAPYIPVNFKEYKDIYVYCDSDPIGYYLNWKRIPYHAVEDGLNCLVNFDAARYDNRGNFNLKVFFSRKLNLIFIQNGYGKYCIDMEVNDIAAIKEPCPQYIELKRQALVDGLDEEGKELIIQAFVRDYDALQKQIAECEGKRDKVLILTEPLCDLETRERLFRDIIKMYEDEYLVFIKPHPRDVLDYRKVFAEYPQFDGAIPMELLNFFPNLRFRKVIGVWTEMKALHFADEVIRLGAEFMDKYESPDVHEGVS